MYFLFGLTFFINNFFFEWFFSLERSSEWLADSYFQRFFSFPSGPRAEAGAVPHDGCSGKLSLNLTNRLLSFPSRRSGTRCDKHREVCVLWFLIPLVPQNLESLSLEAAILGCHGVS